MEDESEIVKPVDGIRLLKFARTEANLGRKTHGLAEQSLSATQTLTRRKLKLVQTAGRWNERHGGTLAHHHCIAAMRISAAIAWLNANRRLLLGDPRRI